MYSFCSEFCILVICWNFIIFENWRKKHSDVAPQIFFQLIIFHCIHVLLSYNWETFQNSFLFGSIFHGRKIINILSS